MRELAWAMLPQADKASWPEAETGSTGGGSIWAARQPQPALPALLAWENKMIKTIIKWAHKWGIGRSDATSRACHWQQPGFFLQGSHTHHDR